MRAMVVAAIVLGSLVACPPGLAQPKTCDTRKIHNITVVEGDCLRGGEATPGREPMSSPGLEYQYIPVCAVTGDHVCNAEALCFANDQEGLLFNVLLHEEIVGQICVTDPVPGGEVGVTPGVVLRAFKRLSWPGSVLVVQPPKGRTLVNFATNFYTTNTSPTRQVVRLLGMRVVIEATPVEYVWQHGDGTSTATSDPGAAFPDLRVTHEYVSTGRVEASVDTVYEGRYRVNGGPWVGIVETLTVAGVAQVLEVIEATPTLVMP